MKNLRFLLLTGFACCAVLQLLPQYVHAAIASDFESEAVLVDTDGDGIIDALDREPAVWSNWCEEEESIFQDLTVTTQVTCAAQLTIQVESTISVDSSGDLELIAPTVMFSPGFSVHGQLYVHTVNPLSGFEPPPVDCDENPTDPSCIPAPCGDEGQELVFETQDWVNQGGQVLLALGRTGTSADILASRITTTLNPGYGGQIELGPTVGTGNVGRRVWISSCPGGPPIDQDLATSFCDVSGTEIFLRWAQSYYAGRCELGTDTVYYINYKNLNCDNSICAAYRNLRNNGEP